MAGGVITLQGQSAAVPAVCCRGSRYSECQTSPCIYSCELSYNFIKLVSDLEGSKETKFSSISGK